MRAWAATWFGESLLGGADMESYLEYLTAVQGRLFGIQGVGVTARAILLVVRGLGNNLRAMR